jgi:argininosuccinate lyase
MGESKEGWSLMSVARGGRLEAAVDEAMQRLNTSVGVDSALWRQDILGSMVHARGLERAGVLTQDEASRIVSGLKEVAAEIDSGGFVWDPVKEDVHMNIESRLVELIGPVGGKLHTGRSRNDQIATDLRLYVRDQIDVTLGRLSQFAEVLLGRADQELNTLMPAYTHLQRAQPSRLSHHLLAWQQMLWRDRGRLLDARKRLNESPLGSGAVAGTGFALPREWVASELGFDRPTQNSLDATASRDFLMEAVSALTILAVHLSRIGEEIVLWSTREFGFIELSDRFSTSSSMMPQKKNPDVAELVRGRAALVVGNVTSLYVLEKSLCFGYGRDLQEDKRPVMDAFESVQICLAALSGAILTATFSRERMRAALEQGHVCATDLADLLVCEGMPFREAHHVVGGLVREAEARGCQLSELPREILLANHPTLVFERILSALDPEKAVERRVLIGGPAKATVVAAIAQAKKDWEL